MSRVVDLNDRRIQRENEKIRADLDTPKPAPKNDGSKPSK